MILRKIKIFEFNFRDFVKNNSSNAHIRLFPIIKLEYHNILIIK